MAHSIGTRSNRVGSVEREAVAPRYCVLPPERSQDTVSDVA
jgi:hypothetical protein